MITVFLMFVFSRNATIH